MCNFEDFFILFYLVFKVGERKKGHMTQILNEGLYLNQKVGSWKPFESFD